MLLTYLEFTLEFESTMYILTLNLNL